MTTTPPTIIVSGGGSRLQPPSAAPRRALWAVGFIVVLAVVLQVSVMPYIRVGDGIPDLVACAVTGVALLRGPMVGAVAGVAGGLLVELTAPIGTLGVLALLYLVAGFWTGGYCERDESHGLLPPIVLVMVAAAGVQLAGAAVQLMLGVPVFAANYTARVLVPTIVLTGLIAAPVLLVCRKLLGEPRLTEPFQGPLA
ncbi:MAG: rod shape-determining protein MreD [Thermoleophilia bacterium]